MRAEEQCEGRGITKGGENGESSCRPVRPKRSGGREEDGEKDKGH